MNLVSPLEFDISIVRLLLYSLNIENEFVVNGGATIVSKTKFLLSVSGEIVNQIASFRPYPILECDGGENIFRRKPTDLASKYECENACKVFV